MTWPSLYRYFSASALTLLIALPAGAQSIVGKDKTGPVPNPVNLDTTGMFQAKFVSVGDDMFIGGQPTEKALRELRAKGVTTVVNLRMPEEMAQVGFDEAALVKELGMKYVHIPMRGTPRIRTGRRNSTPSRRRWRRRTARCSCTAPSPGGRVISGPPTSFVSGTCRWRRRCRRRG